MIKRLADWTFRRHGVLLGRSAVLIWWEKRRPIFNLVVGLAGLLTCALCFLTGTITEKLTGDSIGIPDPPVFVIVLIVFYAVAANVAYTFGAVTEIIAVRKWKEKAVFFGEISFALGLFFSVVITLLPALLVIILAITTVIIRGHHGDLWG